MKIRGRDEGFKIATYNVNSIRSRIHTVIFWLQEQRPHLLCMQETKVEDAHFPVKEFEHIGYHVVYRGGRQRNGVAIASLEELEGVSFGLDDGGPADEDRLVRGIYNGISVVNTYVPQGQKVGTFQFKYKLEWFDRLKAFFDKHYSPEGPLIWCGDINVAPEDIDVHNPRRLLGHVCFCPEVWEAFRKVKAWGFVDIFRRHHPGEPGQYTFYDYRVRGAVERSLGWRVDHILATRPLAERSLDCFIDLNPRLGPKPSDHTPMVALFPF